MEHPGTIRHPFREELGARSWDVVRLPGVEEHIFLTYFLPLYLHHYYSY